MKVQVLSSTDMKVRFVVEGVNHAFVNAIRRALLSEVPKLAFEDVTIYDNTSALFDEMLAHRVGLVPVKTDLGAIVPRDACDACNGEGCPNCTVIYTLSKEGPCTVYSGDMTPADPKLEMPDKRIPLVKLLEGQRVMLEAAAILGTPNEHAKWQCVTCAAYREYPVINFRSNAPLPPGTAQKLAQLAPKGSIEIRDGRIHVVDQEKAWDFLWSARDMYDLDGVELTTDPRRFIFTVETDGSLTPSEAVEFVLDTLSGKLEEIENEVTTLKVPAA
ncbi:MAG TPA: DNA-directed RNA polymerase subunit D [Candidatus Thermoplasmatota archaeon]|nr:DNA-directed RNA polymerase subunit D [Candidatus Thermoplasmatota archaeon]